MKGVKYTYKDRGWNRCEVCGRFIAFDDFDRGAIRRMVTPDTAFTAETYETLCREHAKARHTPSQAQR